MTEKSVLTKSGPMAGTRPAFPNSLAGGATKHDALIHWSALWLAAPVAQPEIRLGRFQLLSLPPFWKKTPDWLLVSIRGTGNPEEILSMTVTCQLPRRVLVTGLQSPPKCFP